MSLGLTIITIILGVIAFKLLSGLIRNIVVIVLILAILGFLGVLPIFPFVHHQLIPFGQYILHYHHK